MFVCPRSPAFFSSFSLPRRSFSFATVFYRLQLWRGFVVAYVLDLKQQHHRVVFMKGVMAMQGVIATEITEAEEQLSSFIEIERENILPRVLH